MIVTAISKQKKSDRLSVYIDGEYAFSLIKEDIIYFKIKENEEISQKTVDFITENVNYIKAQDTALKYLSYKMRTEKEVRKKLEESQYSDFLIEKVMDFLKKYGYINDFEYCCAFIRQTKRIKPLGRLAIKQRLRMYGANDEDIENAIAHCGIDETSQARALLEKKLGERNFYELDIKEKKKIEAFLLRRGYSYSIVRDVFKSIDE